MVASALTLSRAEVFALLLRAARGAGVPLGHCEDLARAVADHGGARAVSAAASALARGWSPFEPSEKDGVVTVANACAIAALPCSIDAIRAGMREVRFEGVDEPELLPPYLAHAAGQGGPHLAAVAFGPDLHITRSEGVPPPKRLDRIDVEEGALSTLQELAARTYVPATDASRAGAGAGTNDND